jgi:hypothetical protein
MEYFWGNDKALKRMGIIFLGEWFYPATYSSRLSPLPAKTRNCQRYLYVIDVCFQL